MSRTETTAMLSELVEKRLKNRVSFWASEVNFDLGTSKNRRIDFMGFKPFTPGYVLMPASVELGEFSCYEVKSCMADFKSGHGLTFYGDVNYLVTTRELAEELRVNYLLPRNINQVLTPSKKRRQARTAFRRVRQVSILQVPRRKRNAVRDDRSERKENELSKTIKYVECAHCGQRVGTYYVTCPYCGYKLVDAMQSIGEALPW